MAHPKFAGWDEVPLDAPLRMGDVWVWILEGRKPSPVEYEKAVDPNFGIPVGPYCVGNIQSSESNYPKWLAYRRNGKFSLKGNPNFSKPLPLP